MRRICRKQELVKTKTVFAKREMNEVLAGGGHIEPDLARLTAMVGLSSLLRCPCPSVFAFSPLHALAGLGPLLVQSDVDPIVFSAC